MSTLIERLSDEADLCRNDGADDIARLLDEARAALAPAGEPEYVQAEFADLPRAALLWVLWHHQGASSPVGQPIRYALGMDAHSHLGEHDIAEAKRWAERTRSTTAEFHCPPSPDRAERERCARIVEQYPEWLGPQAKKEIAAALRGNDEPMAIPDRAEVLRLARELNRRFTSGNSVSIDKAMVPTAEWQELRAALVKLLGGE